MITVSHEGPINGVVTVPGSKYVANRALILGSLAGSTRLHNLPTNQDITHAIDCLQKLGISIHSQENQKKISVHLQRKTWTSNAHVDVGDSGTLLRFITALCSLVKGKSIITGSNRIQQRPIQPLVKSLHDLGREITTTNGFAPLTVHDGLLQGGHTTIPGNVSSQFLSALLLVSPYAQQSVQITLSSPLVSKKYVDLTIQLMKRFGVEVKRKEYQEFFITPSPYHPQEFTIPSDWSSANYFFAAAAITKGSVTVKNLDTNLEHGESQFVSLLQQMGCELTQTSGEVTIQHRSLKGIDVDMSDCPDAVPLLAVVAACAEGKTHITNIAHLQYKESDRIRDLVTELRKLNITCEHTEDTITIHPSTPKTATINPHNDHRLAMSLSLLGLVLPIHIENETCVNKSFPEYWQKLKQLGVNIT